MFSGLPWVIRLGDFSQGEEKGKKLNDMRKKESKTPTRGEGRMLCALVCARARHLLCARVRQVCVRVCVCT